MADGLGVFSPSIGLAGFAQDFGHRGERHSAAVDGCGKVGAETRQAFDLRAFASIVIRTGVGNSLPAWTVVLAGIPGAETFAEAGAAGVAIATEPGIPAGTGRVGLVEQYGFA